MVTGTPGTALPRDIIVRRLMEDMIGPHAADEVLTARPSDVYATGILWPMNLLLDPADDDQLGAGDDSGGEDGGSGEQEQVSAHTMRRPATAGLSFAIAGDNHVTVEVRFAMYSLEEESTGEGKPAKRWRRNPVEIELPSVQLAPGQQDTDLSPYGAPAGVKLHLRSIRYGDGLLSTATLLNGGSAELSRDSIEQRTLFQTSVVVRPLSGTRLVARPSRRAEVDEDDKTSALLYRNAVEYAAGHTCSATWTVDQEASEASSVQTTWLPTAIVPAIDPNGHELFQELPPESLKAEWLSQAALDALLPSLRGLCTAYRSWIALQREKTLTAEEHRRLAEQNLRICEDIAARMELGIVALEQDPHAMKAFQLANLAMAVQYGWDPERSKRGPLRWRPFQLGFLLLALDSTCHPKSDDRSVMDLLWFPTGGGKTEAYLGLVAFIAMYRRLAYGRSGGGVAALMRYTLRLLTTQQFARASALILACEAIRRGKEPRAGDVSSLGTEPFSIGLWVGGDASPNKRADSYSSLRGDGQSSSPKQLTHCPACHARLSWRQASADAPVIVRCETDACVLFEAKGSLGIRTVDEDLYTDPATLVIGTVDKFAQVVRKEESASLLRPADCRGPDLIIQDELHLISGPLGTLTGLYEAAIDAIISEGRDRPKIIGSTATIRRAPDQVLALFDRSTCQFPPPAIDHDDSGFAVVDHNRPGRLYAGLASAGRSAKFTLQATAASLLQSVGAAFDSDEVRNYYWTLVTYFNSLRELGGSLVLMQDDVHDSIASLSQVRGNETPRDPKNIEELTSRRTQEEVRDMLDLLEVPAGNDHAVDAVLATNMLSVGVDISRLGLMLVYGQPKGVAEYIQATSRVGRGNVPGLVVTVLNSAKARDRSHFETFRSWHSTLYRDVEATSVTPFASRARDRALHAVLVATVRHLVPGMQSKPLVSADAEAAARQLISLLVERAKRIDEKEVAVEDEFHEKLALWMGRSLNSYWDDWHPKDSLLQSAERAAARRALGRSPGEAWPTMNNMRNVEVGTRFRLADRLKDEDRSE